MLEAVELPPVLTATVPGGELTTLLITVSTLALLIGFSKRLTVLHESHADKVAKAFIHSSAQCPCGGDEGDVWDECQEVLNVYVEGILPV